MGTRRHQPGRHVGGGRRFVAAAAKRPTVTVTAPRRGLFVLCAAPTTEEPNSRGRNGHPSCGRVWRAGGSCVAGTPRRGQRCSPHSARPGPCGMASISSRAPCRSKEGARHRRRGWCRSRACPDGSCRPGEHTRARIDNDGPSARLWRIQRSGSNASVAAGQLADVRTWPMRAHGVGTLPAPDATRRWWRTPPNLRPGQVVRLRVFRRSRGSRRDLSSSIWRIRSLRTSARA
jgi:hypothetical protein